MDNSRNGFRKKNCLSKSQFNKKIRQELNSLDHLRKHNDTTSVTLPISSNTISSAQTQFNFEDALSNNIYSN